MMITMSGIFNFFISLSICVCLGNVCAAQSNSKSDSMMAPNTPIVPASADSTSMIKPKKNNWLSYQPTAYFIGIDAAKTIYNLFDPKRVRLETSLDMCLPNKNWLCVNASYVNASFSSPSLAYNSNSSGLLLAMHKSLFPFINSIDKDNGFIGLGYGVSINDIGEAQYTISDIWGESKGTVGAKTNTAHFVELNAGFRMAVKPRWIVGWRIQGKAMINGKTFRSIAPVYIANYGSGDKSAIFGYNLMVCYRIF
jgi:Domain of unknown function (DUF6048)